MGKEADIISGMATIVWIRYSRKPAKSRISAYADDTRKKCET